MWGTQKPQGTYPSKRRFISTCCGKNDYFRAVATVLRSPSPRVWRAQGKTQRELAEHRLIPTCVGSTDGYRNRSVSLTAHPHVCGEHSVDDDTGARVAGSSPRVWGALADELLRVKGHRLIPTCVGSTFLENVLGCFAQAHPHVCGEHWPASYNPQLAYGSSPRVWGAQGALAVDRCGGRLIPTCVGSTHTKTCG